MADGLWERVLDRLLPEPGADLDVDGLTIAGIPGLRCRCLPKSRVVLYRPDTAAGVLLQLPTDDEADARQTDSKAPAASPPDTTRPPPHTKQRSVLHRSCFGQDPFEDGP
ncbi:hypothetical protein AB0L50_09680 [Streptomyces flaveolus]|uniref:hypothetical protein n=1 Tax=Streptomyces flaveolus TaxID=67297 RepID=UPI00341B0172